MLGAQYGFRGEGTDQVYRVASQNSESGAHMVIKTLSTEHRAHPRCSYRCLSMDFLSACSSHASDGPRDNSACAAARRATGTRYGEQET